MSMGRERERARASGALGSGFSESQGDLHRHGRSVSSNAVPVTADAPPMDLEAFAECMARSPHLASGPDRMICIAWAYFGRAAPATLRLCYHELATASEALELFNAASLTLVPKVSLDKAGTVMAAGLAGFHPLTLWNTAQKIAARATCKVLETHVAALVHPL